MVDDEYTVITRRDAEAALVMLVDHFNEPVETVHLLNSPANSAHLSKLIQQYLAGNTEEHRLLDG